MRKLDIAYQDTMKSSKIKLADLLRVSLREAEEKAADDKDKAEEKPEADAEDADAEEENPFGSPEGGEDDKEDKDADTGKKPDSKAIIVNFKRPSVKRYNDQEFLDTQGELVALDKNGATLKISDGSTIFVNFNDIV